MSKTRTTAFLVGSLLVASAPVEVLAVRLLGASQQQAEPKQEKKQEVKVLRRVEPIYPDEANRAGVEGKVVVEATVETTGEVSYSRVVTGHRLLNQAALDAIKQWRFSNTYDDPVTLEITFDFHQGTQQTPQPPQSKSEDGAVKPVHKVDAIYPEEAKRKGVQGEVVVEITIDENGTVTDAHMKSGPELLRQAAVDAVKQFRFANSLESKVMATITFNFVLGGKDERGKRKKPQTY